MLSTGRALSGAFAALALGIVIGMLLPRPYVLQPGQFQTVVTVGRGTPKYVLFWMPESTVAVLNDSTLFIRLPRNEEPPQE